MNFLNRKFLLGDLELPSNVFYAPLAGCSDFPFRKMSARYRPGLMYAEMTKMDALVRGDTGTYQMLDFDKSMHPIGAQLCGSNPEYAGKAAKILEDMGFDVIDLNCGCPVDKVTKGGGGSGLLKDPDLIGELLSEMVAKVKVPVTVKIRAGWDEECLNAPEITRIAESAGAKAICIHGRTRKQGYKGPANWDWIKECREAAKEIKIIGNGDVFSAQAAEDMFKHVGCDAILVSRGTLGQPWIADDIYRHLEGLPKVERTLEDYRQALYEHFLYTVEYQNDRKTMVDMRRVGCWYLKKASGTREFRQKISKVSSVEEARDLILHFPLGDLIEEEEEGENNCESSC